MNIHEHIPEAKCCNAAAHRKYSPGGNSDTTVLFADNRPAAVTQQKLHQLAHDFSRATLPATVAQRKGNQLPGVASVLAAKPAEITNNDELKEATALENIGKLITYYNNQTPDHEYDMQLYLVTKIQAQISEWEKVRGATTKKDNIWNKAWLQIGDSVEERRLKIDAIKSAAAAEAGIVRQQGFDDARKKHLDDRDALSGYLQNGANARNDRMLQNSCEWIRSGRVKLYAITPTGDSWARLKANYRNPAQDEAFFPEGLGSPAGEISAAPVFYNKDNLNDQTNVSIKPGGKTTGGWNGPGYIAVVRPFVKSQAAVWETLRHETQHEADMHLGRDSQAGAHAAAANVRYDVPVPHMPMFTHTEGEEPYEAERALQRYKTEFRAYAYQEANPQGPYSKLSNHTQNQQHDGMAFTERQLAIFKHIYANYEHTKNHWDQNSLLADGHTTFRQAVAAYWEPDSEGFNKYNSLRVDNFYRALDDIGTKTAKNRKETEEGIDIAPVGAPESDPAAVSVQNILQVIAKLHWEDANYIWYESPAMRQKINKHLTGPALKAVQEAVRKNCVPDQMFEYF